MRLDADWEVRGLLDRRVIILTREIRALYLQTAELADRYNAGLQTRHERLRKACRPREGAVRELNYFDNVFDRHEALQKAAKDPQVRRRMQLVQFGLWVVIFMLVWQTMMVTPGTMYAGVLLAMALAIATRIIYSRLVTGSEPMRRNLRAQLVERGVPICIDCGYDLRGSIERRCPECGKPSRAPAG